eukprot:7129392-Heterocapsa_arctica.AAC.1
MDQTNEGEQNQEDIDTQDYKHIQEHGNNNCGDIANTCNKRGYDDKEEEQYPGVSSQKRVKLRAEQLFHEAQVLKKEQQAEAEQKRARTNNDK